MYKITNCLVFNNQAEGAVNFYCSLFKVSRILSKTYCAENEPSGPPGAVRTIAFQLHGHNYIAVNGGSHFQFTDGMSLMVNCDTQEEIDYFWEKLSAGGQTVQCGWLIDKFGMRWQVVPRILGEMMAHPDHRKSDRVMKAVLSMKKLELQQIKAAFEEDDGESDDIYIEHELH